MRDLRAEGPKAQIRVYRLTDVSISSLAWPAAPKPVGPELLRDTGFAEASDGKSTGWPANGQTTLDNTGRKMHNGVACACKPQDGLSGFTQTVSIEPGRRYMLGAYVRDNGVWVQSALLRVNWLDAAGPEAGGMPRLALYQGVSLVALVVWLAVAGFGLSRSLRRVHSRVEVGDGNVQLLACQGRDDHAR